MLLSRRGHIHVQQHFALGRTARVHIHAEFVVAFFDERRGLQLGVVAEGKVQLRAARCARHKQLDEPRGTESELRAIARAQQREPHLSRDGRRGRARAVAEQHQTAE